MHAPISEGALRAESRSAIGRCRGEKRRLSSFAGVLVCSILLLAGSSPAYPQSAPLSEQMAATVMDRWKDSWELQPGRSERWSYDQGVVMKGMEGVWLKTADGKYFRFIQQSIDRFVRDDGTIRTYEIGEYNINNINNGKLLLLLYKVTGEEKYRKAAALLREQLKTHPRTTEGGYWHKQIYPSQMWLDGLYMGEPFYAEYAATFHEDSAFDDIARQFGLMELHSRDAKTGLLYHAWDESRKQRCPIRPRDVRQNFWGRAMGFVDGAGGHSGLLSQDHPQRRGADQDSRTTGKRGASTRTETGL